jgi:dienelactone hydrolase
MTQIVLFHHVQGLTPGLVAFADALRAAGHTVHTPDLFGGRTFATVEDGLAFTAAEAEWPEWIERAALAIDDLPGEVVYGGFSFGTGAVHKLAQSKPGALGALFFHGFVHPQWMGPLPGGVPVQIHAKADDPFFLEDGGTDGARDAIKDLAQAELFVYDGDQHLFADSSLAAYDPAATDLLTERVIAFLAAV